jgi:hypothetical protein
MGAIRRRPRRPGGHPGDAFLPEQDDNTRFRYYKDGLSPAEAGRKPIILRPCGMGFATAQHPAALMSAVMPHSAAREYG